jgi:hypothetical protein
MNFGMVEFIETKDFQYVRIFKNGNGSVMKCIKEKYGDNGYTSTNHLNKKTRWVVIRDPYERFISGLAYDLKRHKVKIEDVNIKKLFYMHQLHLRNSWSGNFKHSISQMPFMLTTQITHFIDIKDLNIFLKMHFGKTEKINNNNSKKQEVENFLDKNDIMKYLHMDYYVYNFIKTSPFLWEWQHGKIF